MNSAAAQQQAEEEEAGELESLQAAYKRQMKRYQLKEQRSEEWTVDDQLDFDEAKSALKKHMKANKQKKKAEEQKAVKREASMWTKDLNKIGWKLPAILLGISVLIITLCFIADPP